MLKYLLGALALILASATIGSAVAGHGQLACLCAFPAWLLYLATDRVASAELHSWVRANQHRYERTAE